MDHQKHILVIGCLGFIGTHVVAYAKKLGFQVTGCDLHDHSGTGYHYVRVSPGNQPWDALLNGQPFDYCINAGGNGNVGYSIQEPYRDFQSNTNDTASLLDALRRLQPNCRYVHISSAAVYGNPSSLPVKESAHCKPMSPYGWHKWMSELICREYAELFHQPIAIVRPFSVYGPGLRKQIFWDTYQKYLLSPSQVELWGTGSESRDFIYIEDACKAMFLILEKADMHGEVYNLGSGVETRISEAVTKLFYSLQQQPHILFNGKQRAGDPLQWRADIGKLTSLGFSADVSLDEGMKQLAEWLRSQT